jgi:hypothetical protein
VDEEDLKGNAPKKYTPAITTAMEYHRLLHRAEEPDYPETARRRYLEQNEKFEKFMADWKTKAAKSGDDGCPV